MQTLLHTPQQFGSNAVEASSVRVAPDDVWVADISHAFFDDNLLGVRLTDVAFDAREVTERAALGCEDIQVNSRVSLFVTQPEN